MRLNMFLQRAGIGSRREAERIVAEGRVTVNGDKAMPTTPVQDGDKVTLDGQPIAIETRAQPRLFMLHKPVDVITSTYDSEGRMVVFDLPALNKPGLPRLMNVGRLDVNSEGLLLFSTDGKLAQTMMDPNTALERVYRVRVHGRLSDEDIDRLRRGITIEGIRYKGARVEEEKEPTGKNTWYRVVLTEGKNREIRRLMEHFGCVVNRLIRLQYGPFRLGELPSGKMEEIPAPIVAKFITGLQKR